MTVLVQQLEVEGLWFRTMMFTIVHLYIDIIYDIFTD